MKYNYFERDSEEWMFTRRASIQAKEHSYQNIIPFVHDSKAWMFTRRASIQAKEHSYQNIIPFVRDSKAWMFTLCVFDLLRAGRTTRLR